MAEPKKTKARAAPGPKSPVIKRSIMINRHKTSISLEDDFWNALQEISAAQGIQPSQLVAIIDQPREHTNLSSAIRLYVLNYYRSRASGR
jgi:predicted DNA-binding ribbon-helix-helix protein